MDKTGESEIIAEVHPEFLEEETDILADEDFMTDHELFLAELEKQYPVKAEQEQNSEFAQRILVDKQHLEIFVYFRGQFLGLASEVGPNRWEVHIDPVESTPWTYCESAEKAVRLLQNFSQL